MSSLDVALLVLRIVAGLTFAAHGAQKAFGWWGGPGPERWHGAIHSMGFRPSRLFWFLSMTAELAGGLFLALGLLTPLAAAVLLAQSMVIVFHVHWSKGFFNTRGGWEFALQLASAAFAIGLAGPGQASIDYALRDSFSLTLRVALLVLGIVAGALSLAVPRVAPREAGSEA